ncbi:hypothetical protein SLS53_008436 [Cytospora paraplurivora]|uniref:Lytic polysaccharide monooxygenase n=1 Tax=Cytospora paraplurivora TaxID=2898453 RepID=A0AAN9U0F3_9PEZI
MHSSHTPSLAIAFLAILLVLVQLASADNIISKRHVQMVTPQPYIFDEYGPTNPLNPDGSDYPCKVPQGEKFQISAGSTPTEMVTGEPQVVSFAGTAVHGGGSCQFALTEGLSPTRDSAWKVIHSIEGGCPKANVEGNLEAGESPDNYTFSVPDDFAQGEYTFAWTWVNRIAGEPEFYMNCAPVTVKAAAGAGSKRDVKERRAAQGRARRGQSGSYPDLFLANIGNASNGCTTSEALQEQVAIAYPYPGAPVLWSGGVHLRYCGEHGDLYWYGGPDDTFGFDWLASALDARHFDFTFYFDVNFFSVIRFFHTCYFDSIHGRSVGYNSHFEQYMYGWTPDVRGWNAVPHLHGWGVDRTPRPCVEREV